MFGYDRVTSVRRSGSHGQPLRLSHGRLRWMARRRLSNKTAAVLGLFVGNPELKTFGRDIIRYTGIPSGSLYPILHRLEERGYLLSEWESLDIAVQNGRRPRRMYQLDPRGAERAAEDLPDPSPTPAKAHASLKPRPAAP